MLPNIINEDSITVVLPNSGPKVIHASHPKFEAVKEKLRQHADAQEISDLMDVGYQIERQSLGEITVTDNEVWYGDQRLPDQVLEKYILRMLKEGQDITPAVKFAERLMQNPDYQLVHGQLFSFLQHHNRPLTEDGRFLADKGVNPNYTDCYSGKIDNSPGQVVEVPRNQVDNDPNRTCSFGLHVGNFQYVRSFGIRKMLVAVGPEDVVSVPYDYHSTKMRVCKYEVLYELHDYETDNRRLEQTSVYKHEYGTGTYDIEVVALDTDGEYIKTTVHDIHCADREEAEEMAKEEVMNSWDVDDGAVRVRQIVRFTPFHEEEEEEETDDWIVTVRALTDSGTLVEGTIQIVNEAEDEALRIAEHETSIPEINWKSTTTERLDPETIKPYDIERL